MWRSMPACLQIDWWPPADVGASQETCSSGKWLTALYDVTHDTYYCRSCSSANVLCGTIPERRKEAVTKRGSLAPSPFKPRPSPDVPFRLFWGRERKRRRVVKGVLHEMMKHETALLHQKSSSNRGSPEMAMANNLSRSDLRPGNNTRLTSGRSIP